MKKMQKDTVKNFVETHPELVSVKETSNPDLLVLKYKNKVFYKNLWTPEICECRGTVIDKNWDIVSRPFTKIFNYGEALAPEIAGDDMVMSTRKINGFMGAITVYNGELLYSTTGTIDSDYAKLLKNTVERFCDVDMIQRFLSDYKFVAGKPVTKKYTMIVEICLKEDEHIVPEKEGVYLLSIRRNAWDSENHPFSEFMLDAVADGCGMLRPEWSERTFDEVLDDIKTCNHEGFVVYTTSCKYPHDKELKIKSPYYLVTKFLGRMGKNNVDKMFDDPEKFKASMDEEFYSVIDYITNDMSKESWETFTNQEKIGIVRGFIDMERKSG